MNSKLQIYTALIVSAIASSAHCDLVPSLDPIISPTTFSDSLYIVSVNWCPTCNLLAVGGADANNGLVGVYQFDQITENFSLTVTATLGSEVDAVAWCPDCAILAAGGADSNLNALIQIYGVQTNPAVLEPVTSTTISTNSAVISLDWCNGCNFLAAATFCRVDEVVCLIPHHSILQVYRFTESPAALVPMVGGSVQIDDIYSIKWCPDCSYLAIGSDALYVYNFNAETGLVFAASAQNNTDYNSVDWCDNCEYIAAGGFNHTSQLAVLDIYHFNSSIQSLTTVTSIIISSDSFVDSVKWCQGCDNLAVGGGDGDARQGIFQLYHFDSSKGSLTLISTPTLDYFAASLDWCGDCCNYLAVGGADAYISNGYVQLFQGNTVCLTAPTNLTAHKIYHRFPTQIDIINQLCWDQVTNAVAYNVYADAALTILLARITEPQLCYSQHQICAGKPTAYYVTSVDVNGNQSSPAVVTI